MSISKLDINDFGNLIFMSRTAIYYPKDTIGYDLYKKVGGYILKKDALDFFLKTKPGNIERAEEIELLRFLENHRRVLTVQIDS